MKLDIKSIELIEKSDAYYIIVIKDEKNFSLMRGIYSEQIQTVKKIVEGMLGIVNESINKNNLGNSQPLMLFIMQAIKKFPIFKK